VADESTPTLIRAERGPGDQGLEGGLERLERAVVVQVVRLDVGHDRQGGLEDLERAVALVGLDHQEVAAVPHRIGADLAHVRTDQKRRGEAGLDQDEGQHRRGRGLAVGARHRHRAAGGGDGGEHLGPAHHHDATAAGRVELDIVGRHRR